MTKKTEPKDCKSVTGAQGPATSVLIGITIFLGAFLLFGLQPLIGRFLLPWFGGTPEVWTTCMLFFQLFLLAGYAWSDVSIHHLSPRYQTCIQLILLVMATVTLSIVPGQTLKPSASDNPILKILLICTLSVGLPYFLLSTTGPLLQAWFSRLMPYRSPYRLYALSNTGSLLALICFPLVFEPHFTRAALARFWSLGFILYACLYALVAVLSAGHPALPQAGAATARKTPIPPGHLLLWIALPACASVELLAVTTKITQDIAVIPFLWIAPLCLYLISFILCFDHPRWYIRPVFLALFILGIVGVILARNYEEQIHVKLLIILYLAMLFTCSMVCHGELFRLRPDASRLTTYYLAISAGGALGGILVAVVAPMVFRVYHELHLGLLAAAAAVLMAQQGLSVEFQKRRRLWIAALVLTGLLGLFLQGRKSVKDQTAIDSVRNFFGVLTVWEEAPDKPDEHKLLLQHGTTFHGLQFQSPAKKALPTSYYNRQSGIGLLLDLMPTEDPRHIGVVGLGVGTLCAYGRPGDTLAFYEINPEVERLARKYFTYLADCKATTRVLLGDARLTLDNQPPQQYDVLVLDAFSSDSIPTHLLTQQAMEIYLKHLAPDGVLAFHISTMHLDLNSVIRKQAEAFKMKSLWIENDDYSEVGALSSEWILLSLKADRLDHPVLKNHAGNSGAVPDPSIRLWTDDYINLLQALRTDPAK